MKSKNRLAVMAVIMALILGVSGCTSQSGGGAKGLDKQLSLAESYHDEKDYEAEIEAYEIALELDDENVDVYLGLAEAYVALGKYDKAIKVLKEGYDKTESSKLKKKIQKLEDEKESILASGDGEGQGGSEGQGSDGQGGNGSGGESDGNGNGGSGGEDTPTPTPAPTPIPVILEQVDMHITQVDTSDYPNVSLYFYARDLQGNYLDNIPLDAFHLFECLDNNWKEQTGVVKNMDKINERSVSLVMDVSGSMYSDLGTEVYAAQSLLESMKQDGGYMAALTVFSDYYQEMSPYTTDLSYVQSLLSGLYADGCTALYDTLENSLYKAVNQTGQKYVLAFTDGMNNVGSTTKEDVIRLSKAYKIPIYIIYMTSGTDASFIRDMQDIASASGGDVIAIDYIDQLEGMYDSIFTMQQNLYSFSYTTSASGQSEMRVSLQSDQYVGETQTQYIADELRMEKIDNSLITDVTASSVRDPMKDGTGVMVYYNPINLIDGNYSTAWVEGVKGRGEGEWFKITLNDQHYVNGMEIANGYWKRYDLYLRNSRPKRLRFTFSDGTVYETDLADTFVGVSRVDFGEGVKTSEILVEIVSTYEEQTYEGKRSWDDTCITEINLY